MATDVGICNVGLSRIGIDQYIEDLSDPRPAAVACSLHLPLCRQEMLQQHLWPFAMTTRALALVSGVTVPGWTYVYQYPVDCLRVVQLTDEGGARVFRTAWEQFDYDPISPIPYRVMGHPTEPESRIIVTDLELAYLWYVQDVTDPNRLTPLFRNALSWRLAADLALALKADAGRAQYAREEYQRQESIAIAHAFNETGDSVPQPETITVRY